MYTKIVLRSAKDFNPPSKNQEKTDNCWSRMTGWRLRLSSKHHKVTDKPVNLTTRAHTFSVFLNKISHREITT